MAREAEHMRAISMRTKKETLRSFKTRDGKQMIRTEISRVKAEYRKHQAIVKVMSKHERSALAAKNAFFNLRSRWVPGPRIG